MKVLIVSPVFWPEVFRVNDLAERLAEFGCEVEVLAGHPNYPEGRFYVGYGWWGPWVERWQGVRVLRFPQVPRGRGQAWRLGLQYLSYVVLGSLRLLARGRWDWDVVLVFQTTPVTAALPGLLARSLSGARGVIWVQDLWPDSLEAVGLRMPQPLRRAVGALSSAIYRAFDCVLGQNEAFLPRLQAMGVDPGRLASVPQWADEGPSLDDPSVPPAWGPGFTVLFAGNLGRAQGLEAVLEAADLARGTAGLQWVLMGDGSQREWLQAEVQRRGLAAKVLLPGHRPAAEMAAHYRRADVLLVSLRRDPAMADTLPGKLQACLAAGRPLLGAVEGVAARVIEEAKAGLITPPGSPGALAEAVRHLMACPDEERDRFGANGRTYYLTHFGREACVKGILHALEAQGAARKV